MTNTTFTYTGKGGIQRKADFLQAAERHLADAGLLFTEGSWDNSCYHSGYATECTVKLVLFLVNSRWHGHLNELIPLLQGSAATYLDPLAFGQMPITAQATGWSPEMRYDPSSVLSAQAQSWLTDSRAIFSTTRAKLLANGVL